MAIARGEYSRGALLPPETDLAQRFGVSRQTVNRALAILEAEGLVRVERPRGTIVSEIPPILRNAVSRYQREERERGESRGAFDTEVRTLGRTPRAELRVERVIPPTRVAELLGISANEVSAVVRERKMFVDDVPVQIATSYIPLDIAAGTAIEQEDSGPGGIISRFAELGHAQARITEHIEVRPPAAEEATFLRMTEDQRVFDVTHVGWTSEDRAVEVALHVMPTHQWQLDYEWPTA
jgi:GntR family transcriptional regulator